VDFPGQRVRRGSFSVMPVDLPCSDASRLRDEPLLATASRVERWLLVEQCGPWGPPAIPLGRMDAALGRHLTAEAARGGARLVLLRHPRGVDCPPGRHVFLVDSRPGRESVLHRSFADDAELADAALPLAEGPTDGWEPFAGPLLLVCTHGKHDQCCALRGRPVAEALAGRYPERTWECSHVGGDRFAANLVVLPEGYYLGRLEAAEVGRAVADLRAGRLPLPNLRGRSSLPLPVQAAQHFARTELDRDGTDDLVLADQTTDGPDRWVVRLTGAADLPDVEVRVQYERRATEPARLTCQADRDNVAPQFTCLELTTLVR
jgi:hypothetical protein